MVVTNNKNIKLYIHHKTTIRIKFIGTPLNDNNTEFPK